jgi:hypothetical protein
MVGLNKKLPMLDFHQPTTSMHISLDEFGHDANTLVIEIGYVFCTFVSTFDTST